MEENSYMSTTAAAAGFPDTNTASIAPGAIRYVDQFFDGTVDDIMNETVQNARRAGATLIEIRTTSDGVEMMDDGAGIEDPRELLRFGGSGWSEPLQTAERPAGMGIYAFAGSRSTIPRVTRGEVISRLKDGTERRNSEEWPETAEIRSRMRRAGRTIKPAPMTIDPVERITLRLDTTRKAADGSIEAGTRRRDPGPRFGRRRAGLRDGGLRTAASGVTTRRSPLGIQPGLRLGRGRRDLRRGLRRI